LRTNLKQIFLTGLAVIIPIGLTLYIIVFLIDTADSLLRVIPAKYHPDSVFGFRIPGLGIIFTVILIFISGLVTKSFFGRRIIQRGEELVEKVPFVGSIYQGIKKVSDGMLADRKTSFKKVVLVEFPRKGVYTIGFITGMPAGEIEKRSGQKCFGVFLPTTPNPTSGYLIMVPENELIIIDMSVEEALTYIISLGMVSSKEGLRKYEKLPHEMNREERQEERSEDG